MLSQKYKSAFFGQLSPLSGKYLERLWLCSIILIDDTEYCVSLWNSLCHKGHFSVFLTICRYKKSSIQFSLLYQIFRVAVLPRGCVINLFWVPTELDFPAYLLVFLPFSLAMALFCTFHVFINDILKNFINIKEIFNFFTILL